MIKRFLSVALLLCTIGCAASGQAAVEIKPEPQPEDIVLDANNPLKTPVSGLYELNLPMEDGTSRTVYHYFPENLAYRQPLVTVAMPSDADIATFAEASNWLSTADRYGFSVLFMSVGEAGWAEDEQPFMNAVFDYMDSRKYYVCQDSAFYLVGYGDAAGLIMTEAAMHADRYAGAAAFGLEDMDTDLLEELDSTESALPGVMQSEIALPVWIGAKEKNEGVQALIDFFVEANECGEMPASNAYADEIYEFTPYLNTTNELNTEHVSKVLVSWGERDYYAADFVDYLYGEFLRHVRRQDSYSVGSLRYFASYEELGMDRCTLTVDGIEREFYVYVPTAVREGSKSDVPMVISMHGGGGSGEEFYARAGWVPVAEERNCIAVFPTGSNVDVGNAAVYSGVAPRSGWAMSDIPFIQDLVAYMLENYSVDSTRVYINGQSQGSGMAQNLAAVCPELFAAAGFCSAVTDVSAIEGLTEETIIPVMISVGKLDKYNPYGTENAETVEQRELYWAERYGINSEENHSTYQNGSMNIDLYSTDEGVPLARFQWVDDKVHAIIPDEAYAFYDYFIQWSRDEDGTLYYQGKAVEL